MVSELDTKQCASKNTRPQRGVVLGVPRRLEKGTSASEDEGLRREVDCEIPHRLGRRMNNSLRGCGNFFSLVDTFYKH